MSLNRVVSFKLHDLISRKEYRVDENHSVLLSHKLVDTATRCLYYYAEVSTAGAALETITIAGRINRPFNS